MRLFDFPIHHLWNQELIPMHNLLLGLRFQVWATAEATGASKAPCIWFITKSIYKEPCTKSRSWNNLRRFLWSSSFQDFREVKQKWLWQRLHLCTWTVKLVKVDWWNDLRHWRQLGIPCSLWTVLQEEVMIYTRRCLRKCSELRLQPRCQKRDGKTHEPV